uniref:Inner centromere protein n=1 Tax=Rousettus aegyptiacus TaxID=9407 RepID=A0A7J8H1A6_ROUAE|nr:inner centromere protein [Rousettus aegyptiacus]
MTTPQDPKGRGVGAGRSASKLRIARTSPGLQGSPGSPASPWRERVLAPILPDNCSTPTGSRAAPQSTRHSPIAPSSPGPQASLSQKASLVAKTEDTVRRSSRRIAKKATKEQAPSARIICHSYLERLLNIEVPQKVSPKQKEPTEEAESVEVAEREVPKNDGNTLWSHSATKIAISTPGSRPGAGGQEIPSEGQQEAKNDQAGDPKEPPQSVRRKRSYKQAVSELDEEQQLEEEGEELQPPRSKTPSPPCPASKVVRPLRTFLHTVQRNQMLMTPTSASRSSVMKSFIKRNTPLRVDPKEKERQRLENLRRKEEAEQLRRQKVEEDKRRRLEEVKLKREERLRKVLQARERVEQMKEEKKKQIEQKFAQLDEKTEKAKEERLAEEKAKKKAAAKKMEEAEVRKKKEEEQERLRKAAEARRLAEQREQERQLAEQERRREQERLQAERELQEREKALRLQREKLDLEDIFKKSKPRYHKRTSSAVWNSPPLQGPRVPGSLAYSLKKH